MEVNRPLMTRPRLLFRGFTGRCAVCSHVMLTSRWVRVREACPRCQFPIERSQGHFVGAVGMNTIVTFGVILLGLLAAIWFASPEPLATGPVSLVLGAGAVVVSVVFYPISKTLWSAIDLMLTPLEPGEVDPRYDPHVLIGD